MSEYLEEVFRRCDTEDFSTDVEENEDPEIVSETIKELERAYRGLYANYRELKKG